MDGRRTTGVVIAVLACVLLLPKQERTSAQAPDTMAALLVEVRGLRAALEQLASAGPRVQLLFGRLQLQEQRVTGHFRRLEVVRDRIRDTEREMQQMSEQVTRMENGLKSINNPEERTHLEQSLVIGRQEIGRLTAALSALKTEEATINNDIAVEQGRWSEINQRLEELERALRR